MYLHDDKAAFRAAVLSCADSLGMSPAYVAKDYFIVLLLKEITGRNPDVVFKGFEWADVVVRLGSKPAVLWQGAVDTRARVIPEPDLEEAGMAANRELDLCWRRT